MAAPKPCAPCDDAGCHIPAIGNSSLQTVNTAIISVLCQMRGFLETQASPLENIIYTDETNPLLVYVGEAVPGSLPAAPVWKLKVVDTVTANITKVLFAESETTFDKIWNDRATYTYG